MWLRDYHVDGLRLDAVHALVDTPRAAPAGGAGRRGRRRWPTQLGRPLTLIAESDLNDPRLVTAREAGGYGLDAQWSDDVHHALHAALTGETQGYYADFGSLAVLAKALTRGVLPRRHLVDVPRAGPRPPGRPRRAPRRTGSSVCLPEPRPGRQPRRRRPARRTWPRRPAARRRGAAADLARSRPMLFMGEEWARRTPWQFFTSHPEPELAEAVGRGPASRSSRRTAGTAAECPTRRTRRRSQRSKLDWSELAGDAARRACSTCTGELIALRRAQPELTDPRLDRVGRDAATRTPGGWSCTARGGLLIVASLADVPLRVADARAADRDAGRLPAGRAAGRHGGHHARPPRWPSWRADGRGRRALD